LHATCNKFLTLRERFDSMINLEKQKLVQHAFPLGKIPNEFLIANNSIDGRKSRYPVFDICKWNLEYNLKHERLPHHSKNTKRLHQALKMFGNLQLEKRTLLDAATHARHAKNLYKRLLRNFGKSLITIELTNKKHAHLGVPKNGYFESLDHQIARTLIRFITVIHAVEAIDIDVALEKAQELKREIIEYVSMMPGAACLGVLEIEVTSIKLSRRIRDFVHAQTRNDISSTDEDGVMTFGNEPKTYIKLNDCETLSSHLSDDQINGESGQFIIHFHGVLKVEKTEDIKELNKIFLTNPNWNKGKKQVLFKSFSEEWGEYKSIEASLKDIAYYCTKGGAVKQGGNCYLQYNLDMPDGMKMSYEEYLNLSDRNNDSKRQALIEKGDILDLPILTHREINSLALVVNGMMKWNVLGTGYVVSVGKW
jgi:hypothetical protein